MKIVLIAIGYILILINFIVTRTIYINYKSMTNISKRAIDNRDNEIKELKKDQEILLQNAQEDREKIKDLENNIELLVNNSKSKKIKELVIDDKSNN